MAEASEDYHIKVGLLLYSLFAAGIVAEPTLINTGDTLPADILVA